MKWLSLVLGREVIDQREGNVIDSDAIGLNEEYRALTS
jgi:hypothetical protein